MKIVICFFMVFATACCQAQSFDTTRYKVVVDTIPGLNNFFKKDAQWRGGDGASSVDLGNGRILWLFGDTFISDSAGSRINANLPRNTIAIQNGYDLNTATIKYAWKNKKEAISFFPTRDSTWFWPGGGIMLKDRLLIFFMRVKQVTTGLGFETTGWDVALVSNPKENPDKWKMKFVKGTDTYGTVAGSASVLKDKNYIYAFGAVEPGSHDVYLLRWKINNAYKGDLSKTQWWLNDKWGTLPTKENLPKPLFTGATEYSVHYDSSLKKFIQIQSFGFGESSVGLRMSDKVEGPWTEPYMIHTPSYKNIFRPFMYSAKAHPELAGEGFLVTYNINSFDFDELLKNQSIYFPGFIRVKIVRMGN